MYMIRFPNQTILCSKHESVHTNTGIIWLNCLVNIISNSNS